VYDVIDIIALGHTEEKTKEGHWYGTFTHTLQSRKCQVQAVRQRTSKVGSRAHTLLGLNEYISLSLYFTLLRCVGCGMCCVVELL